MGDSKYVGRMYFYLLLCITVISFFLSTLENGDYKEDLGGRIFFFDSENKYSSYALVCFSWFSKSSCAFSEYLNSWWD